jgi:CDP-diacylglycerol--glycerol-3-phosphate 3-phosphatidyltransferase
MSIFIRANLSEQYFTNRQDRYMWITNAPLLANFYHQLILTIGSCSFKLDQRGQLLLLHKNNNNNNNHNNNNQTIPDPTNDPIAFKSFGLF